MTAAPRPAHPPEVEALLRRVEGLRRLAEEDPEQIARVAQGVFEELETALEELRVADTELREAQELLAARQELDDERRRYRELFQLAPDGYLVTDLQGLIREANRAAGELLGLRPGQLVGKPVALFVPRDAVREFRTRLSGAAEADHPLRWELRLQPRRGEPFPAALTVARSGGSRGAPAGLRWLLRDVTGETLAREELAASRQRLEAHLDNSPLAVIEFAPDFRILRWSRGAERMFGWTAADVTGRALEELRWVHEHDAEAVRRMCAALLDGTSPRSRHANRNYRKDGSILLCEWYSSAIYDSQGRLASVLSQVLDVTERGRAEAALAESERNFREIFEQAPGGVALVDLDGRFLRVNPALQRLLGYTQPELLARRWQELTHPEDLERDLGQVRALIDGELDVYRTEKRYLPKEGAPIWASLSVSVMRDAKGAPQCLLPMLQDISERKRLEAELGASWERYMLAERVAHLGTWERSLVEDAGWWSPECYRIFGVDPDAFRPTLEAVLARVHPDDRDGLVAAVRRSAGSGRDMEHEYRIVLPNGTVRTLRSAAQVVPDAAGRPAKLVGALLDVTAQRQAEALIRESERRLRILADALPQLVWTALPDGTVDYYNRRVLQYGGISTQPDGSWVWAPVLHPDDEAKTVQAWEEAVAQGTVYEVEHRVRMKDGGYRWHLSRGVPVSDAEGRVVRWFGTATDIQATKEAEAELRQARDEAQAAVEAKSQFLTNMSHEIRTPLAGVLGMAQVLDGTALDPEQRECVDAIRLSGKLLLGIVNDILDLSKFEAAGVALESVEFALRNAVEDTVHLQAEAAWAKGLELCCVVEPEVPSRARGDPGRLRQILLNLVGNAVKFTGRGHVAVRARLAGAAAGKVPLRVEVEDTGVGIPEPAQERLFQDFAQGDASTTRRFGGSGLGLAICRRLVEAMGGEIGFTSTKGRGSTFWFAVPLDAAAGQQETPVRPALVGARALVAAVHPAARGCLIEKLSRLGMEPIGAADAEAAPRRAGGPGAQGQPQP
ncbi:MAG: PAS domain S-box protein, partial [Thermodesulfobacteriota bacterium]